MYNDLNFSHVKEIVMHVIGSPNLTIPVDLSGSETKKYYYYGWAISEI